MNQPVMNESGEWFQNEQLDQMSALKDTASRICRRINMTTEMARRETVRLLALLLGEYSRDAVILAPFHAEYGAFTQIGSGVLIFQNCSLLDEGGITIKDRVCIGANCLMNTSAALYSPASILIEEDVWIGENVTIHPGVTIGKGSIITAGSHVDRDIPAGVIAAGNPCRIITAAAEC